jgi:hypothetical protein
MSTITLTFSECVENSTGMEHIGDTSDSGFKKNDIYKAINYCKTHNIKHNLYDLSKLIPPGLVDNECCLFLVMKQFINHEKSKQMFDMLSQLNWDSKYFDVRRNKVLNKHARHNLCFANYNSEPDYENRMGRVYNMSNIPDLFVLKEQIKDMINLDLFCEGNYYYDLRKCGIGWHGDGERKKNVGVRFGDTLDLHFRWYYMNQIVSNTLTVTLNSGDAYIMGDKTIGNDWKKRNIYTLRHACGKQSGI